MGNSAATDGFMPWMPCNRLLDELVSRDFLA